MKSFHPATWLRLTVIGLVLSAAGRALGDIRLWDANHRYPEKSYSMTETAWKDRKDWRQVPYGTTEYGFKGDAVLEGENFWLFLHSSPHDSVFLYAKTDVEGTPGRHNELYRVYDTPNGLRNYGQGSQLVKVLVNTAGGIEVLSEARSYTRGENPTTVTTVYRVEKGRRWVEVRPVRQADELGMHGESRFLAAPAWNSAPSEGSWRNQPARKKTETENAFVVFTRASLISR